MAGQRVVDSDVHRILTTTLDTQPFIESAHLVVEERLVAAGYSAARLQQLELWLAAHLACLNDPRASRVDAGEASATYESGKLGMGLESTRYGQQVLWLDYLAVLALDNQTRRPASLRVD